MAKDLPPGHGGYRATTPAERRQKSAQTSSIKKKTDVPAPPKSSKGGPTSAR
jgi:hypothetical protein